MSVHVKVFVAILVLGAAAILGYKFALPHLQDSWQRETSDAAGTQGKLRIGTDSWIGYWPLCSAETQRRVRAGGYALRCEEDKGDLAERMRKLASGELDFAVATVDAYLLNGAPLDFPATIVAVIDESRGGDAIVARRSSVPDLEALKRKTDAKIAFTPASPSEHLLKSIGTHFGLPQLAQRKGAWRVEATGSDDALKKLTSSKVDVAVLWEPDVSKALADTQYVKLIGTDDTEKLIVDVLLASRRVAQERPEAVKMLLTEYFDALRVYSEDPAKLHADVAATTGLPGTQVDAMLGGVRWASLSDNGATWFGVTPTGLPSQEGLVEAISGAVNVLLESGDFARSPLPDQDPYRLTNRQFVAGLYLKQIGASNAPGRANDGLARAFPALEDAAWERLKPVGTFKIAPVSFERGSANLSEDGRSALNAVAEKLSHYPNYRLVIRGHTGIDGDPAANLDLSKRRAQTALDYFVSTFHVDPNRIRAAGYGASQPLPRQEGESDRAYAYRLPRVEFALVSEHY